MNTSSVPITSSFFYKIVCIQALAYFLVFADTFVLSWRIDRLEQLAVDRNAASAHIVSHDTVPAMPDYTYTYVNVARFEMDDEFSFSYEDPAGGYYYSYGPDSSETHDEYEATDAYYDDYVPNSAK